MTFASWELGIARGTVCYFDSSAMATARADHLGRRGSWGRFVTWEDLDQGDLSLCRYIAFRSLLCGDRNLPDHHYAFCDSTHSCDGFKGGKKICIMGEKDLPRYYGVYFSNKRLLDIYRASHKRVRV